MAKDLVAVGWRALNAGPVRRSRFNRNAARRPGRPGRLVFT